jgi:hypothetical protein
VNSNRGTPSLETERIRRIERILLRKEYGMTSLLAVVARAMEMVVGLEKREISLAANLAS